MWKICSLLGFFTRVNALIPTDNGPQPPSIPTSPRLDLIVPPLAGRRGVRQRRRAFRTPSPSPPRPRSRAASALTPPGPRRTCLCCRRRRRPRPPSPRRVLRLSASRLLPRRSQAPSDARTESPSAPCMRWSRLAALGLASASAWARRPQASPRRPRLGLARARVAGGTFDVAGRALDGAQATGDARRLLAAARRSRSTAADLAPASPSARGAGAPSRRSPLALATTQGAGGADDARDGATAGGALATSPWPSG